MMRAPSWNRLPWQRADLRRALLLALASGLSFAIAYFLHLRNAYWAAMPVWVISQPARGVLVERALFRALGTLVGAAVGLGLAVAPVPPLAKITLLALWIAANAGTTLLLRGVHGYGALLAGITGAVVLLPTLVTPAAPLTIAVTRVECTLIGVLVASAVMALQTPASPLAAFYAEVRAVAAEAIAFATFVLRGETFEDGREERRILAHISHLDQSARIHAAGSVEGYRRLGDVDRLLLASLSIMAAARAVRDGHSRIEPALLERLERVQQQLGQGMASAALDPLTWADPELQRLENGVGDLLAAEHALFQPDSSRVYRPEPGPAGLAPHREWNLAGRQALLAGVASFAALALVVAMGSPAMGMAAMGVCVFVMVLGSMPLPERVAPMLITGVVLGVLAAVGYRLLLQPVVTGPASLFLSLAPFLLLGGLFRTHPRVGAAGIDFSMCFLLASQAGMPASHAPARVLLDSGALMASAALMAALFYLLPGRAVGQARDAAEVIRRDLLRILETDREAAPGQWRAKGGRQVLRLALHLSRAKDLGRRWPRGLLAVLNLGQGMTDLRQAGMPEPVLALLSSALNRRRSPQAAAQELLALARAETQEPIQRRIYVLAERLEQAAELLMYCR